MKFKAGTGYTGEDLLRIKHLTVREPSDEHQEETSTLLGWWVTEGRRCYWSPGTRFPDRSVSLERAFWSELVSQRSFSHPGESISGTERREIPWLLPFLHPPISPQSLCCSNPARSQMTQQPGEQNFQRSARPLPFITEQVKQSSREGFEGTEAQEKHQLTYKVGLALGVHRLSLSTNFLATGLPPW